MPQVPIYQQQARPEALPGARFNTEAPLEAFGGGQSAQGVTNAVQNVAGKAENYFQEEKKKADDMAVLNAGYQVARLKNELMYGREGALGLKGLDAAGAPDKYIPKFQQGVEDIGANLTADQRVKFEHIKLSHQADFEGDLRRHATTERNVFYEGVMKNGVSQAQDDAILRWNQSGSRINPATGKTESVPWNQDYIRQKLGEQDAYIVTHAQANGRVSPEEVKNQIAIAHSQTHEKIINSILDSDNPEKGTLAKRYLEANHDDIRDGETLTKVTKAVRDATQLGEAQKAADKIFVAKGGDLLASDAEAQKIVDPKQREMTQKIIRDKSELQKNAAEIQRNKVFNPAYQQVAAGKDPTTLPQAVKDSLHPDDMEKLNRIHEKQQDDSWRKQSAPILMELRMKLADPVNGKTYAQGLNLLRDYADKLHPDDMKEASKLQASAISEDRKPLDQIWNPGRAADDALEGLHIKDSASQGIARGKVLEWYKAETDRTGKAPDSVATAAKADYIARDLLRKGLIRQTFPKPPKEDKYNTPENNKTVSDEIGAVSLKDKQAGKASKAIDAAVGAAWQTMHEVGVTMSPDDLRKSVREMSDTYTLEKRSFLGFDALAKDVTKRGYEIGISDVPGPAREAITKALTNKGAPANDRSIVYYYIKGLAAKKVTSGGK